MINGYRQVCSLPRIWKSSKVIPILKPNKSGNCFCFPRLVKYWNRLSKRSLFCSSMIRTPFLPFFFTIQSLLKIRHLIKSAFSSRSSTGTVLLDIKACILKMLKSFKDKSFKVYLPTSSLHSIAIGAGCLQGSCLSSIPCNIFTTNIPL